MTFLTQFASAAAEPSTDIFTSLGIDWKMLIVQIISFLLLVFILGKWVYPWLMKSVDERQAKIEAANKAAEEATKAAEDAEEKMQALLEDARKQAADIVATARQESAAQLAESEAKAKKHAEHIVESAHDQLQKDILAARKALEKDTIELVALATEKVVRQKVDSKTDADLIGQAIKEAK